MIRIAAILALVFVSTACVGRPDENATGEEIFLQLCSNCHSADLTGGIGPPLGPGTNAADQTDEFLQMTISVGRGRMPSFSASLNDDQLARLIDYIRIEQGK